MLAEAPADRKKWVENPLEELAELFAIAMGGFSVMGSFKKCVKEPLSRLANRLGSSRTGTLEGLSLGSFLLLVNYTRGLPQSALTTA